MFINKENDDIIICKKCNFKICAFCFYNCYYEKYFYLICPNCKKRISL